MPQSTFPSLLPFALSLALSLLGGFLLAGCASMPSTSFEGPPRIAHDVFFELNDAQDSGELIEDCYGMLGGIDGVLVLQAGRRCAAKDGEVNDTAYHVALRVLFRDEAALDGYITAADHVAFVEKHRDRWASVRVFDTEIGSR